MKEIPSCIKLDSVHHMILIQRKEHVEKEKGPRLLIEETKEVKDHEW